MEAFKLPRGRSHRTRSSLTECRMSQLPILQKFKCSSLRQWTEATRDPHSVAPIGLGRVVGGPSLRTIRSSPWSYHFLQVLMEISGCPLNVPSKTNGDQPKLGIKSSVGFHFDLGPAGGRLWVWQTEGSAFGETC
jgi:hypothetical protein